MSSLAPAKDPRNVIHRLRRSKLIGVEVDDDEIAQGIQGLQRTLHLACETLSCELYSKEARLTTELIQNADDNIYLPGVIPCLQFELTTTSLTTRNNEIGFTEQDVEALCDIRRSTKATRSHCTGEKGIGFKSVFRLSESPHVRSNGFSFCFNAQRVGTFGMELNEHQLGYVVPQWVDDFPVAEGIVPETTVHLPFRTGETWQPEQLFRDLHPTLLLFLRNLKNIELTLPADGNQVKFRRLMRKEFGGAVVVTEKESVVGEFAEDLESRKEANFILRKKSFDKPESLEHEARRLYATSVEVACAFPVDASGAPVSLPVGSPNLFAFLPIKDAGFRFLVNADFLMPASREDLLECDWNCWLRSCLLEVVLDSITTAFHEEPELRYSYFSFLPLHGELRGVVLAPFVRELYEALRKRECMPGENGQSMLPNKTLLLEDGDAPVRDLFGADWLLEAVGAKPIDSRVNVEAHRQILISLGCKVFQFQQLLACLRLKDRLHKQPPRWFLKLYNFLAERYPSKYVELKGLFIFPLETERRLGEKETIQSFSDGVKSRVFLLPERAESTALGSFENSETQQMGNKRDDVSSLLKLGLPVLHHEATPATKSMARKFLLQIGVFEPNQSNVICQFLLPLYSKECCWTHLDDDEMLEHVCYIDHTLMGVRDLPIHEKQELTRQCQSSLRLRAISATNVAKWNPKTVYKSPKELYFDNEELRSLFEGMDNIFFVHPQYEEWLEHPRELLSELGVVDVPRLQTSKESIHSKNRIFEKYGAAPQRRSYEKYIVTTMCLPDALVSAVRKEPARLVKMLVLLDRMWPSYAAQLQLTVQCFHDDYWGCYKHGWCQCSDPDCSDLEYLSNRKGVREKLACVLVEKLRTCHIETTSREQLPLSKCYERSQSMRDIFRDRAPYVPFEFGSQDFRAALGIGCEPSVEVLLQRLQSLADDKNPSVSTPANRRPSPCDKPSRIDQSDFALAQRIYRALSTKAHGSTHGCTEILLKAFKERALIVVPLSLPASSAANTQPLKVEWCSWEQVCWNGDKEDRHLFGSSFRFLYDHHWHLHDFFQGQLQIRSRIGLQEVLVQLRKTASNGDKSPLALQRLRTIYGKLSTEIGRLTDRGGTASTRKQLEVLDSLTEPVFRTTNGQYVRPDSSVVLPDDADLLDLFRKHSSVKILDVEPESISELRSLSNYFNLKMLSDCVESVLLPRCATKAKFDKQRSQSLRASIPHVARCIAYAYPASIREEREQFVTRWITLARRLQCHLVPDLQVERRLQHRSVKQQRLAHADLKNMIVYLDEESVCNNVDSVWPQIGRAILRLTTVAVPQDRRESLELTVQLLFVTQTPEAMHTVFTSGCLAMMSMQPLPPQLQQKLTEAINDPDDDLAVAEHCNDKKPAETDLTSCSMADLATAFCRKLVVVGKLQSSPSSIHEDCEAKLVRVFHAFNWNKAKHQSSNEKALKQLVRDASEDEAWIDDVSLDLVRFLKMVLQQRHRVMSPHEAPSSLGNHPVQHQEEELYEQQCEQNQRQHHLQERPNPIKQFQLNAEQEQLQQQQLTCGQWPVPTLSGQQGSQQQQPQHVANSQWPMPPTWQHPAQLQQVSPMQLQLLQRLQCVEGFSQTANSLQHQYHNYQRHHQFPQQLQGQFQQNLQGQPSSSHIQQPWQSHSLPQSWMMQQTQYQNGHNQFCTGQTSFGFQIVQPQLQTQPQPPEEPCESKTFENGVREDQTLSGNVHSGGGSLQATEENQRQKETNIDNAEASLRSCTSNPQETLPQQKVDFSSQKRRQQLLENEETTTIDQASASLGGIWFVDGGSFQFELVIEDDERVIFKDEDYAEGTLRFIGGWWEGDIGTGTIRLRLDDAGVNLVLQFKKLPTDEWGERFFAVKEIVVARAPETCETNCAADEQVQQSSARNKAPTKGRLMNAKIAKTQQVTPTAPHPSSQGQQWHKRTIGWHEKESAHEILEEWLKSLSLSKETSEFRVRDRKGNKVEGAQPSEDIYPITIEVKQAYVENEKHAGVVGETHNQSGLGDDNRNQHHEQGSTVCLEDSADSQLIPDSQPISDQVANATSCQSDDSSKVGDVSPGAANTTRRFAQWGQHANSKGQESSESRTSSAQPQGSSTMQDIIQRELEGKVVNELKRKGGSMPLSEFQKSCPSVRKRDLKDLRAIEMVPSSSGIVIIRLSIEEEEQACHDMPTPHVESHANTLCTVLEGIVESPSGRQDDSFQKEQGEHAQVRWSDVEIDEGATPILNSGSEALHRTFDARGSLGAFPEVCEPLVSENADNACENENTCNCSNVSNTVRNVQATWAERARARATASSSSSLPRKPIVTDGSLRTFPQSTRPPAITKEPGENSRQHGDPTAIHSHRDVKNEIPRLIAQLQRMKDGTVAREVLENTEQSMTNAPPKISAMAVGNKPGRNQGNKLFIAGLQKGIQALNDQQSRPLRDVEMAIKTVWDIYCENAGHDVMEGRVQRHLPEATEQKLSVKKVLFSHYKVSNTFGSGRHQGEPIESLVEALEQGTIQSTDLVLTAGSFNGRIHSLNNRRLWAIKEFQRLHPEKEVEVGVRLYNLCPVTAKFILSYSTADEGASVKIGDS